MKKGFTLVELLGVIVIPAIINTIKEKNEDADNYKLKMIENAARLYMKDNGLSGNQCISIDTLRSTKYLNDIDVDENYVSVTYVNSEASYNLVSSCS